VTASICAMQKNASLLLMGVVTTRPSSSLTLQSAAAGLSAGPTPASVTPRPGTTQSASLVQPLFRQLPPPSSDEQVQPLGHGMAKLHWIDVSQRGGGWAQSAVDEQGM
jgi:hypothetical protein